MSRLPKPVVPFGQTFEKLDIRVGRILEVTLETRTHKPTYKMVVDFGKFGRCTSYDPFSCHPPEEVRDWGAARKSSPGTPQGQGPGSRPGPGWWRHRTWN